MIEDEKPARAAEEPTKRELGAEITRLGGWLCDLYALDLDFRGEHFMVSPKLARQLLPEASPRTGLLVIEEAEEMLLGIYVDPRDEANIGTLVEETSHLVCLAWHAARDLQISPLILELQGEIDRFLYGCHRQDHDAGRGLAGFEGDVEWADWVNARSRDRYEIARDRARRYCRRLASQFATRDDVAGLALELRRFYRTSPSAKLRAC